MNTPAYNKAPANGPCATEPITSTWPPVNAHGPCTCHETPLAYGEGMSRVRSPSCPTHGLPTTAWEPMPYDWGGDDRCTVEEGT